jgi:glycosyltransferase involved in cell wall biosynthesis
MQSVAIVMPVYNEVESIEETLTEIMAKIVSKSNDIRLFISEDGSTDGTKEKLLSLESNLPGKLSVSTSPKRKGYPKAAREAILNVDSAYDYILFMDSDGQYEPKDFFLIWAERNNADFVIGARTSRVEPIYRRILSRGLNRLIRAFFKVSTRDATSAFRLMRRPVAQAIAGDVKYSKYSFWSEFTARSGILEVKSLDVPISYRSRVGGSKVYRLGKMPRIIWDEFRALAKTRNELRTPLSG